MVMCHPQLWWSNRDHGQWLPTIHWGGLSWNGGWGRRCYLSLWYNKVTLWVEASKGTIFIHQYWYWSLFYRILVLLPWTHAVWVQLQLKEGYSHPKGQLHSQLLMRRTTESSGDLYWFQFKAGFEKYNTNYAHKYISKWNVERQPSVWEGKLQSLEGRTQLYRDFYFNYSAGHRMLENSIDMFSHIYFTTIYLFQLLFWMSGSSGKVLWMLYELNIWPNSFCASFDFFSFFTQFK